MDTLSFENVWKCERTDLMTKKGITIHSFKTPLRVYTAKNLIERGEGGKRKLPKN